MDHGSRQLSDSGKEFALNQNYPNPFNPVTQIKYQVPTASKVTLKVYDILGREVATLVDQVRTAGVYSVSFNGSSLSSGVYFYRMTAGKFNQTKRLISSEVRFEVSPGGIRFRRLLESDRRACIPPSSKYGS